MPASGKKLVLPLLLTAMTAASAGAQQKECDIDEGKPGEVGRAMLALQMAQAAKGDDGAKNLRSAVASIEKADKSKNPVGQSFVLGKALVMYMDLPSSTPVTTRGAVGFTQNPGAPLDLVTTIDSLFRVVETALPECKSATMPWRAQKGWVSMINGAIAALNNDKADSAEMLAKRSNTLNPHAPYGYMVLANLAQKRNQPRVAIDQYKLTIEKAGTDTAYGDLRRQTLLAAGNMAVDASEAATGAEKAAYLADARWAFDELVKESAYPQYSDAGRQGLARLATASGDTNAVRQTYADLIANPGKYGYQPLLMAGVTAARSKQVGDATQLFEAAYKKNAYHRDVLYNLAIMYLNSEQPAKAVPVIRQLVSVDPSNGENYQLYSIAYAKEQQAFNEKIKAYNALKKSAKAPKSVKAYDDTARIFFDSAKAVADSAVRFSVISDSFPVKLVFTDFSAQEDKGTLGGTVTNNTKETKTYTVKVDFLDATGKVIATQTANVGPVAPGQSGKFSVQADGAGIAAFRYAPLVDVATIKVKMGG